MSSHRGFDQSSCALKMATIAEVLLPLGQKLKVKMGYRAELWTPVLRMINQLQSKEKSLSSLLNLSNDLEYSLEFIKKATIKPDQRK